MGEIKHIDYVGFSFNGKHSSELGIVRTSEGSRFNENLLPTIQDKTVQVPGGDGTYYFGSYYTQKQFTISYAFDTLTEDQLKQLKEVFGDKKIHDLIFDETPYKIYRAKVTGTASIKHIPFGEGSKNRIYKGEGSIQFTAYEPHARCTNKYLNDEYYKDFDNIDEWRDAANLLNEQGNFDKLIDTNKINLYNPGVKEVDFVLTLDFDSTARVIPAGSIDIGADRKLWFREIKAQGEDDCIKINTKLNLIEGYKNGLKSGNIYNQHFEAGTFFKIPVTIDKSNPVQLVLDGVSNNFVGIEYNYLYF